jgi:hypothetical protein
VAAPTQEFSFVKVEMEVYRFADANQVLVTCKSDGLVEHCRIPKDKLSTNENLLLKVQGDNPCTYGIFSYYQDIQKIEVDQSMLMDFNSKLQYQEFHLNIPE